MISVIEKPKKPAFKILRKNSELFVNEAPNLLTVIVNNRQPRIEPKNKPDQDSEIGLPPQPKEYIRCPEYDWF